jgi:hypothetical protein
MIYARLHSNVETKHAYAKGKGQTCENEGVRDLCAIDLQTIIIGKEFFQIVNRWLNTRVIRPKDNKAESSNPREFHQARPGIITVSHDDFEKNPSTAPTDDKFKICRAYFVCFRSKALGSGSAHAQTTTMHQDLKNISTAITHNRTTNLASKRCRVARLWTNRSGSVTCVLFESGKRYISPASALEFDCLTRLFPSIIDVLP